MLVSYVYPTLMSTGHRRLDYGLLRTILGLKAERRATIELVRVQANIQIESSSNYANLSIQSLAKQLERREARELALRLQQLELLRLSASGERSIGLIKTLARGGHIWPHNRGAGQLSITAAFYLIGASIGYATSLMLGVNFFPRSSLVRPELPVRLEFEPADILVHAEVSLNAQLHHAPPDQCCGQLFRPDIVCHQFEARLFQLPHPARDSRPERNEGVLELRAARWAIPSSAREPQAAAAAAPTVAHKLLEWAPPLQVAPPLGRRNWMRSVVGDVHQHGAGINPPRPAVSNFLFPIQTNQQILGLRLGNGPFASDISSSNPPNLLQVPSACLESEPLPGGCNKRQRAPRLPPPQAPPDPRRAKHQKVCRRHFGVRMN